MPQKSLTGFSLSTGNSDNRGGGCGDFRFTKDDFRYTIYKQNGLTLKDLTEVVDRLKGSKYDYWYELYEGISVSSQTADSLTIQVEFGYGS